MAILARALLTRVSRARRSLRHRRAAVRPPDHPQSQRPARPLSRRRRHEDRFHLPGRAGTSSPPPTADGRKLIVVVFGAPAPRDAQRRGGACCSTAGFAMSPTGQTLEALAGLGGDHAARHARRDLLAAQSAARRCWRCRGGIRRLRDGAGQPRRGRARGAPMLRAAMAGAGHRTARRRDEPVDFDPEFRSSSARSPAGPARSSPPGRRRPTPHRSPVSAYVGGEGGQARRGRRRAHGAEERRQAADEAETCAPSSRRTRGRGWPPRPSAWRESRTDP